MKNIKVEDEVWKRLLLMKINNNYKTINEVVKKLLRGSLCRVVRS